MIIVRVWEGLGNQMFQYAYARALKEKGLDVRLDLNKAYVGAFERYKKNVFRENVIRNYRITLPQINVENYGKYEYLKQETILDKILYWLGTHALWKYKFYEEKEPKYSEKVMEIKGNFYVKGWFQNERYFRDIRHILLKEFVPRKKIKISKQIREALESKESVSIHIRRGDYVKIGHALNLMYYYKALEYMKGVYKKPIFLIFSDDLKWVRENIHIDCEYIYVNASGKLKDYEELFIMSRCSSNIIANSTFSWWGAWLNTNENKHVVAPRQWFEGQSENVPRDWIII